MSTTEPAKVKLNNGGTAVQWRQDGDHPSVVNGMLSRPNGDQVRVSPGDWIVTSPNGRRSSRLDDQAFRAIHQAIEGREVADPDIASSEAIAAAMRDEPVSDTCLLDRIAILERQIKASEQYVARLTGQRDTWRVKADEFREQRNQISKDCDRINAALIAECDGRRIVADDYDPKASYKHNFVMERVREMQSHLASIETALTRD